MRRALLALALLLPFVPAPTPAQATTASPIVVIFMENHERSDIVNSPDAVYLNQIRAQGKDFTHYYGVSHPSLPNYMAFASGGTQGKAGTDSISAGQINAPSLWDQLTAAGVSWRVYEESMPSTCYSGVSSGNYQLKHNPAIPFANVFHSAECQNVQPYTPGVPLAAVTFIAPNMCNDMHDCSIKTGDNWLAANVPPMLAAGAKVIVTWDEGDSSTNGGGNIYTVDVKTGMTPVVRGRTYNHYSLLAGIEKKFALPFLGAAATARPLPI